MKNEMAEEFYLLAKEDFEACEGLTSLGISIRVCCFHAQQALEKSFKAILAYHHIKFPLTHDLIDLFILLEKQTITPPVALPLLKQLNPYAVRLRYGMLEEEELPDIKQTTEMTRGVLNWCAEILNANA